MISMDASMSIADRTNESRHKKGIDSRLANRATVMVKLIAERFNSVPQIKSELFLKELQEAIYSLLAEGVSMHLIKENLFHAIESAKHRNINARGFALNAVAKESFSLRNRNIFLLFLILFGLVQAACNGYSTTDYENDYVDYDASEDDSDEMVTRDEALPDANMPMPGGDYISLTIIPRNGEAQTFHPSTDEQRSNLEQLAAAVKNHQGSNIGLFAVPTLISPEKITTMPQVLSAVFVAGIGIIVVADISETQSVADVTNNFLNFFSDVGFEPNTLIEIQYAFENNASQSDTTGVVTADQIADALNPLPAPELIVDVPDLSRPLFDVDVNQPIEVLASIALGKDVVFPPLPADYYDNPGYYVPLSDLEMPDLNSAENLFNSALLTSAADFNWQSMGDWTQAARNIGERKYRDFVNGQLSAEDFEKIIALGALMPSMTAELPQLGGNLASEQVTDIIEKSLQADQMIHDLLQSRIITEHEAEYLLLGVSGTLLFISSHASNLIAMGDQSFTDTFPRLNRLVQNYLNRLQRLGFFPDDVQRIRSIWQTMLGG